ncbi:MAG: excinuclease ABC subunit UvrC [Propionibacteriaceae bacterium]|jgi:excinuclease ABC subunit C|nr:excinuclease ABC subunit UvrC [Propionibacteriaceae bacterium]
MADPASYRPQPGEIPLGPGVYRFIDPGGAVIYVGKAISLRQRLNSYFADPATLPQRTRMMVQTAAKLEWTQVRNELEALQLEYTWIKQYDPRFNVKYRDDKTYPWLAVTWSEEFPRAFVGRGAKRPGWRYFGPFGQAWAIRDALDTLLTVFPLRTCSNGVFKTARAQGRPCLMGYIGKCSAPCVGRVSAAAHRQLADDFCAVMAGRIAPFQRRFEAEMRAAAADQEYERAARLRDQAQALAKVAESNAVVLPQGTDADVVALAHDPLEVAVQLFRVRGGRLVAERAWVADRADDADPAGLVEAFCLQLYADQLVPGLEAGERRRIVPTEILTPIPLPSGDLLAELLAQERGGPVVVRTPRRGAKKDLLETAGRNAADALARHKTRRASDLATRNRALEEIQRALGMEQPPLRVEGYDVSHLMGSDVVASMVVFEDGLARKSQYRHFLLHQLGSNDVGALSEVLTRRLGRLRDEEALGAGRSPARPGGTGDGATSAGGSGLAEGDAAALNGSAEPKASVGEVSGDSATTGRVVGGLGTGSGAAVSNGSGGSDDPAGGPNDLDGADDGRDESDPSAADSARAGLVDASTRTARRFSYRPSLIVVDGGAPQVAAAQAVLERLGETGIALCGLAKRLEEVWLPGREHPLILPRTSEGLYLLQRVRDESHRFAITYHRLRRGKAMVESVLDQVPGLGEVRRRALLRQFGSLKQLRLADADQITQVPGFGPRLAALVVAAVAERPPGQAVNLTTGEITDLG